MCLGKAKHQETPSVTKQNEEEYLFRYLEKCHTTGRNHRGLSSFKTECWDLVSVHPQILRNTYFAPIDVEFQLLTKV